MKILTLILLILISITAHGESSSEPEDIRQQYLAAVASAKSIDDLDQFLSSSHLEWRKAQIKKLAEKEGKSINEMGDFLLKNIKRAKACVTDLKVINKTKATDTATVTFSFRDVCAEKMARDEPEKYKDAIVENIEEVYFINENGWKIDNGSPGYSIGN